MTTKIETPKELADRLVSEDHYGDLDRRHPIDVLYFAVRERDEQIAAWCDDNEAALLFMAKHEPDRETAMTHEGAARELARLAVMLRGGLPAVPSPPASLRYRVEWTLGEWAAFSGLAAMMADGLICFWSDETTAGIVRRVVGGEGTGWGWRCALPGQRLSDGQWHGGYATKEEARAGANAWLAARCVEALK